ncbi:MAG: TetR/AcrR family transcriptional regulator [Lachnospiraceae bacterium]|nr:TetR/AcrR family transcriptional regulator [Lachnospiraceae bacterium]MBP3295613.1 TetR/AcrR family transcriptional regulator [Lachnospiraceae bacterium]
MNTKERILDEALTLFSEKGYTNVFVGEIAERVGIKAPSLYKHYKNKQAIFDAIIGEMNRRFSVTADMLHITGNDAGKDVGIYQEMSEEKMIELGVSLFQYYLHDDYTRRFRKMLTIEQFHDKALADTYMKQYYDDPLSYQGMLLGMMAAQGFLKTDNVSIMTLHFYAPIYLLLTVCDRDPDREEEAIRILKEHLRQFDQIYGRKKK